MTKALGALKIFTVSAVAFTALFLLAPGARADIVEVEAATSCPGSVGGGLCNGSNPYDAASFFGGGFTVGTVGTEKFVVTDKIGSFSLLYTGASGDNGSCQINGGAATYFNNCTGKNGDGTTFSLGHDDTNHPGMNGPTLITFTARSGQCTAANPCTFDIGFVSWQGTGREVLTPTPEPGTLGLAASGLIGLFGFARRKFRS